MGSAEGARAEIQDGSAKKNGGCVTWTPHRHSERHTCGLHTGYSPNFVYQLLVKSLRFCFIIADFMGIHDGIQYVIRIESKVHMLGRIETSNKESSSNQQHERTSELCRS